MSGQLWRDAGASLLVGQTHQVAITALNHEVANNFAVHLNELDTHSELRSRDRVALVVDGVEHVSDDTRDDAHFLLVRVGEHATAHGVRLARPRLSIGQHGGIVARKEGIQQGQDRVLVHCHLAGTRVEHAVKGEGTVGAHDDL